MERLKSTPGHQARCDGCGELTPNYDITNYGSLEQGYRELCGRCFSTEVAAADGLVGFEYARFEAVRLADSTGKVREFHFSTRLFGPGVSIDAFELRDGDPAGYQFRIIGDPADDQFALFGRLLEKIRRALAIRHLEAGDYGLQIAAHRMVRGRIGYDRDEAGRVPLLTIDGREITWEEFGRMWMTFEGSQFKLELRDRSEEV